MNAEFTVKEKDLVQFKKRRYVRMMLNQAIAKGDISRPEHCQLCNKIGKIQAHHIDYGRPFQILWVCSCCHGQIHRKDHALNPSNNYQSPLPEILDKYGMVTLSFSLPIKTFLAVKKLSDEKKMSISAILRCATIENFPVMDDQLKFNFEDKNETQQIIQQRVPRLLQNENGLLQPKCPSFPLVRKKRHKSLSRMARKLREICI